MEAACPDKAMLLVASDAHVLLTTKFGTCSNHQISWLNWIHPIITCTSCVKKVILHGTSLMAVDHCAVSAA